MKSITLEGQLRKTGTRASRAMRKEDAVPAVVYGYGVDPIHVSVPRLAVRPLVFTDEFHTVDLVVDGTTHQCVVKHVEFHPVTDQVNHIDFQVLVDDRPITLSVPVRAQGSPVGQIAGGRTRQVMRKLKISCLPKFIPEHIDIDATPLQIGQSVQVKDLEVEGVTFLDVQDQTIVMVGRPRGGMSELGEGADEEEEGAEEGEEAATEEA